MKKALTLFASVCLISVIAPVAQGAVPPHLCFGKVATIMGTKRDDVIKGTRSNDVIVGRRGNDRIFGGRGNDLICGNKGNDHLHGDRYSPTNYGPVGNDSLSGGRGNDRLFGDGNASAQGDFFVGKGGDDYITEGVGSTRIWIDFPSFNKVSYRFAVGSVSARFHSDRTITVTGDGTDTIDASEIQSFDGSHYDDTLSGLIYADGGVFRLYLDRGADTLNATPTGVGYVSVRGGPGADTLTGVGEADGENGRDTIIGQDDFTDQLRGGSGSDTLIGGSKADSLDAVDGVAGNDTLDGRGGGDGCSYDEGDTVLNCLYLDPH